MKHLYIASIFTIIVILINLTAFGSDIIKDSIIPIYDSRLSLEETKPNINELKIINQKVKQLADEHWSDISSCGDRVISVTDVTSGSFTRPGAKQKAILYMYCMTGHNFALNGIAIIENNKLKANIMYKGSWDNAIGALPDINGNGLSEILYSSGGTNMGICWGVVSIMEINKKGIKKFGFFRVYEGDGKEQTCIGLFAKKAKKPQILSVYLDCNSKKKLKLYKGMTEASKNEDTTEYILNFY